MFRAQDEGHEKVSMLSPVNTVHVSPEEARAGASMKVTRLQAALTSLGPNDHAERSSLEASLRKAQEQEKQTAQFIERAKKRLTSAEEWVQWAQDWRSECAKELNEAELRLERIRAEAAEPLAAPPAPVVELQCQRPLYSRVQASHPMQSLPKQPSWWRNEFQR